MIRTALRLGRAEAEAVEACGHSKLERASLLAACQTSQRQHDADAGKADKAGNGLQLGHTVASGAIDLAVVHGVGLVAGTIPAQTHLDGFAAGAVRPDQGAMPKGNMSLLISERIRECQLRIRSTLIFFQTVFVVAMRRNAHGFVLSSFL